MSNSHGIPDTCMCRPHAASEGRPGTTKCQPPHSYPPSLPACSRIPFHPSCFLISESCNARHSGLLSYLLNSCGCSGQESECTQAGWRRESFHGSIACPPSRFPLPFPLSPNNLTTPAMGISISGPGLPSLRFVAFIFTFVPLGITTKPTLSACIVLYM